MNSIYKKVTLNKLSAIFSGFAFKRREMVEDPEDSYPIIKIANIQNKKVLKFGSSYFPKNKLVEKQKKYKLERNDFLVAMTGAGSVGKVGKMRNQDQTYFVNQRVGIVRPDLEKVDPEYLFQVLSHDYFEKYLYQIGVGSGQPNVSATDIGNLEVPYPDLHIQQKIASTLSAFDDLIENNTRRIAVLEEMARLIYREWFVQYRYPGHEKDWMVDSGTELGEVPEGWEVKNLEEFGRIETGKTPPKIDPANYGDYIPFIKTPDMHEQIFINKTSEYLSKIGVNSQKNKLLPPNSICVSCIGTAGIVALTSVPSQTNQQINSIILDKDYYREYLYYTIIKLRPLMEKIGSSGATMTNVNKSSFQKLGVVWPGKQLVEKYHEKVAAFFDQILILERKNFKLKQTRDLLLPKLISGEVNL